MSKKLKADKLDGVRQVTDDKGKPPEGPVELEAGAPVADDAAAPAVAAEPVDEATLEEQRKQKLAERSFKDNTRNAIVAKHRQQREDENQAFREGNADQAALSDAVAGAEAPSADLIARMEAEARGEPDPLEQARAPASRAPATPAATPAAASAPEALAPSRNAYKIRVYGEEREASEEDVIRAGIAALQKQHAADVRLEDAATREAQLEEYAGKLEAYAERLRTLRPADGTQPQPTGGSATPQLPAPGAAGQEIRDLRQKAGAALLRGDDEGAAELNAKADEALLRLATSATATAQPPRSSEQGAVPELPARSRREPWSRDDRVKINQVFERDYGDLLHDDDAFIEAQAVMEARLANPAYLGKTAEEMARGVGDYVRRARGQEAPAPTPTPQPSPAAQTLEQRRTLKAQIPLTPPAGSGRAPASTAQAQRYPSRSEYVGQLQHRSGSNSTRR